MFTQRALPPTLQSTAEDAPPAPRSQAALERRAALGTTEWTFENWWARERGEG